MTMRVYNTLTRQKEELAEKKDLLLLYTCGPTVYDFAHIGNLRTYVFEDLLKRTLLLSGFAVKHVMNITDVDDKTIRGANKKKISLKEYTEPYTEAFFEDLKKLQILPADAYPRATDHIEQMIHMIEDLMQKEMAYQGQDRSIYFSIEKFPEYGKLSHLRLEDLKTNAQKRLTEDEYDKDNASDFVLWKAYDEERDGPIFWESPFGKGRPGWHIECSAMVDSLLGKTIDIHCGGVDNIFPHHENEIAQSECFHGETFAKYWMHAEHLIVDGKKMSKSLGNFYTLRDLLEKGYSASVIRMMLLQTHYRMQLNFTMQGLLAAAASLERIGDFIVRLNALQGQESFLEMTKAADRAFQEFQSALQDDLNIAKALAAIFDLIREGNRLIDEGEVSDREGTYVLDILRKMDSVLQVLPFTEEDAPQQLQALLEKRQDARAKKNWPLADQLRDKIHAAGYEIEDTPKGARLKKKTAS